MDCMATWSGMVLKQTKAMLVLRSAATTYHRPAVEGAPISLSASLEREGDDWEAIEVRVEARNAEGQLLAEELFKVIPLPPDKFKGASEDGRISSRLERLVCGTGSAD
jgi:acyl-CoA thioesterase FadM